MRHPETNVQQRARDASQLTFALVGAALPETNSQGKLLEQLSVLPSQGLVSHVPPPNVTRGEDMDQDQDYAACVGIDWSDRKHDICVWIRGQDKPERRVIEHRPEAIQAWAEQMRARFGGAPVAVSVELQEGPIVWALLEHDFIVMFPVKPTTVARYRSAFRPSGAKDDPTDAECVFRRDPISVPTAFDQRSEGKIRLHG